MKQIVEFRQFAEAKIEDASAMAVDQNLPQQWRSSGEGGQEKAVKVAVDEELRASQRRGQFVFVPDIPVCAGKHGLGMRAVAAQFLTGERARSISARAHSLCLCFSKARISSTRQIFDEDCVFFVRFITRRGWLNRN